MSRKRIRLPKLTAYLLVKKKIHPVISPPGISLPPFISPTETPCLRYVDKLRNSGIISKGASLKKVLNRRY